MNAFIMADAAKCIGCRTCEVACVVAHQQNQDCASVSSSAFIPRIRVIKDDAFTTAVACHQCEDAPCANVCPTHAIRREHGHIFVEQARCIGCKSCMLACPFVAGAGDKMRFVLASRGGTSVCRSLPDQRVAVC